MVAEATLAVRGDTNLDNWVRAGVDLDDAVLLTNAGIAVMERHLFLDTEALRMLAALRANGSACT